MPSAHFTHNPYDEGDEQRPENNHHNAAPEPAHHAPIPPVPIPVISVHHSDFLLLIFHSVKEHCEQADGEQCYHIPYHKARDECGECHGILTYINRRVERIEHKCRPNTRKQCHADEANDIYDADPRSRYFQKMC